MHWYFLIRLGNVTGNPRVFQGIFASMADHNESPVIATVAHSPDFANMRFEDKDDERLVPGLDFEGCRHLGLTSVSDSTVHHICINDGANFNYVR